jgi:hypothetical protein
LSKKYVVWGAIALSIAGMSVVACDDDETEATPVAVADGGNDGAQNVTTDGGEDSSADGGSDAVADAAADAANDAPEDAPSDAPADADDAG